MDLVSLNDNIFVLKIRKWIFGFASLFQLVESLVLLPIDFSKSEDPDLQSYHTVRWQLITTWVNVMVMVYYPLSCYCDWQLSLGRQVNQLNKFRNNFFSNLLFPAAMFADVSFLRLWFKNRELIVPYKVDSLVPPMHQHGLHTFSLIILVLDLVLVQRERPKDLKTGVKILCTFVSIYCVMVFAAIIRGIYFYPVFGTLSGFKLALFGVLMYVEHLLYYLLQWHVNDLRDWLRTMYNNDHMKLKSCTTTLNYGFKQTKRIIYMYR